MFRFPLRINVLHQFVRLILKEPWVIEKSTINTTTVWSLLVNNLPATISQLRFLEQVLQHATVFNFAYSHNRNAPWQAVLSQVRQHASHVVEFTAILHRSPLVSAIGQVGDDLIARADAPVRRTRPWVRAAALAACLALVLGLGIYALPKLHTGNAQSAAPDLSAAAGLTVVNSFKISYTLIAISDSAYGVAANNPQLSDFAYQDGNRKGIRFQATYLESSDKFRLFEAEEASDGWQGDSYFKDGNAVTGINYLPSKENADESFYYEFDENGICNGKYTGIVKEDGKIIYSQDGNPDFAGLVRTDGGDYYYFDETLEAAGEGEVYISKTNGLCAEGSYTVLEDKRVVLEKAEEFIDVSEFDEAAEDTFAVSVSAGDTVTTGSSVTLYSEGRLTIKTVVKSGDVDCDGFSDGRDAVLIECIAGGMLASSDITAAQMRAADCNSDSLIEQNDIDLAVQSGLNI